MNIADIMRVMEDYAPAALAEEWDHVGLLIGAPDAEVRRVLVCLDITPAAVAEAVRVGAQLIVSHHPVIFSPLTALPSHSVPYLLAQAGIAAFAAHTNLDKTAGGVNDALAAALGLGEVQPAAGGIGRVGRLSQPLSPEAFAALCSERLHTAVRLRAGLTAVETVGLCSGAGGDQFRPIVAEHPIDAFLTGEMKHHEWMEAASSGLTLVEAGHYATEIGMVGAVTDCLTAALPQLRVMPFVGEAPYQVIVGREESGAYK